MLFKKKKSLLKYILTALLAVVPIYSSSALSMLLDNWLFDGEKSIWLHVIVIITVSLIIAVIFKVIALVNERKNYLKNKRDKIIRHSYDTVIRFISKKQQLIANNEMNKIESQAALSLECINNIINDIYSIFVSHYSFEIPQDDNIDFEVTFMTKSYIDEEITIPAYANYQQLKPVSMNKRNEEKTIYKGTITDIIYSEVAPLIHIMEDCSDNNYKELYPGQKKRIRSSIVVPVVSSENKLLGTVVVHCDKKNFFLKKDAKFWTTLLNIYSKPIGVEKMILDIIYSYHNDIQKVF